ncbi:hypothetical protein BU25DRAFT_339449 [Macroventuria anomochaeta]|uniref:Uncharacterized protein n=1 Tax=Macroventuria anomochaeta TaxID=301207 RepID=A0ACB6S4X6_9PLEO|nr:uncharacterized protein BU25DRAFT_339449 [Macroventuria anomochaeta]KAF2628418.1 hypothetical protein BU25DRAFT_339449 [Macroventuria anomochaeta]
MPFASARNCKTGLNYCGRALLSIGNYKAQVNQALKDEGQPTDQKHIDDALFYCKGGDNGDIEFQSFCGEGRCISGGDNTRDYCRRVVVFKS